MTVSRHGVGLTLPASRKVKALLAYLALAPRPVTRSRLCELLWDIPNDPRGELRWCLSKLRRILDDADRRRVEARADAVRLDLTDCIVDALEIARATQNGVASLDGESLGALSSLFAGELLEGLKIDRSPQFDSWLVAERHRLRGCQIAVLEHLVGSASDDDVFGYLERWRELAPFDPRVHELLLGRLSQLGRIPEGEAHVAATVRLFEADGLDPAPIRDAWRAARRRPRPPVPVGGAVPGWLDSAPASNVGTTTGTGEQPATRRASIAVMPLAEQANTPDGCAGGLVHDVITGLAKLRSLFVIAQGTVFALHERRVGPEEAGRTLNVDYVLTGSLQQPGGRLVVEVELVETRNARIVWSEVFDRVRDDTLLVLDEIAHRIVASIASEIEYAERNRALLKPPSSLDAWEAHHRGLWHMYRFAKADNEQAGHFFETALRLDPTFAPAYAGLSFTHFQNAFQNWARRDVEIEKAYATAGQSLMADDRDPTAHWAMGRALWLRGRQDESVAELEQAVRLSPNFAIGHYALAFVRSQAGDARAAIESADHSRHLSPFDPLLFAILAARAMALVRLGEFDEAAEWAARAAARPNAHPHVIAIAAYSLALAGSLEEARRHLAAVRRTLPHYRLTDFLSAFRYDPYSTELFRKGAGLIWLA